MSSSPLRIEHEPGVLRVQMHRPEAANAIDAALVSGLTAAIDQARRQAELRVFVLEGLPDVFCIGNDFEALTRSSGDELSSREDIGRYFDVLTALTELPLVTVALVRGRANAGGVGFAAACDLVFSDPGATFALSELLFGLLPACVLPFLMRRIGFQRARRLALTTQPIGAEQALDWGLVDEISDDVERLLRLRTSRLACLEPAAIGRLKSYTNQLWTLHPETRRLAVDTIAPLIADPAIRSAIRDFVTEGIYPWQPRNTQSSR